MISGIVLKYLNGECFVIRPGYETALYGSSSFCLTVPAESLASPNIVLATRRGARISRRAQAFSENCRSYFQTQEARDLFVGSTP
jgi:hypothetical protein